MGIQNLLRFVKPFIEPVHIEKYSGKRIGIDAYSWLHKGAYSCSMELCLGSRSDGAKRFLKYFMHHIDLLRHYKITPVVVFDGGNMPCKAATENERHRRRENNLAFAKEKLKQGDVRGAVELFQRAVRITPSMAHQLIQILRKENIEFVVAPYEADAQLAYLSTLDADKGGIDAVITEDSDLIAYCCQVVVFKMDRYGNGEELLLDRVFNSASNELSFKNFDKDLFTGMCVLAGCDFLPSISGIGIKRAYSLISKYRNLDRVLSALKLDKRYQVPNDYPESFRKAVAVFHHATVYDSETKKLEHMKPFQQKDMQSLNGDLEFLGPELPPSIATAIAEGHLNPLTMEAFDYFYKSPGRSDISAVDDCITIFPAKQISNEDISYRDESEMALTQESCITIISDQQQQVGNEEITVTRQPKVDQKKYMKEALSLGKLIAPLESQQEVEIHMERREAPNNNPFKRRKLIDTNPVKNCLSLQVPVLLDGEKSVDVLCSSSPDSQESVESKPNSKTKHSKNTRTKIDNKNSILRFFRSL